MSVALSLVLLAGSIAGLLGAIWLIRLLGQRYRWHAEVSRKAVHIAIGVYALFLPLLFDARWPVVLLILIALALMLALRTPASRAGGLGATIHSVERRSFGDIWLALAIGFVFLHAGDSYILYALPIAVIALSDAAAALAGSSYGRARFAIEDGVKSWEGVAVFFAVTLILAMIMLLLLSDIPRLNVVVLALAVAGFAATVEAVSWRGLDNLFVPIGTHLFLLGYLYADPWALAGLAVAFFAAIIAIAWLTPRLGLSAHASRAFVIAVFLFLGTAGIYGALMPVMVMTTHLIARTRAPCRSAHADLDFIATLCATGLIWFFIGETVGPSAINLFNLSLAGVLLGYLLVIARAGAPIALMVGAGVFALFLLLVRFGPSRAEWVAHLPLLAAVSLALVAAVVAVKADWFGRWRAPRLAALASLLPLGAYFSQTVIA